MGHAKISQPLLIVLAELSGAIEYLHPAHLWERTVTDDIKKRTDECIRFITLKSLLTLVMST